MLESLSRDRQACGIKCEMDATYVGIRTCSGPVVTVRTAQGSGPLRPRRDLIRHCPAGFDWAHSGSGPAQLALALLAHVSGSDRFALKYYQVFKHEIIARLPRGRWELTRTQVLQSLRFVCPAAQLISTEPTSSECGPRKIAIIQAILPGNGCDFEISVQGRGRSARTAAVRAMLNLLGCRYLRRRRISSLWLKLSVVSGAQEGETLPAK